jgi:hypothetical protein
VLALGTFVAVLALPPISRAGSVPGEYEVKAALLFNFAKFVEWPANSFASPEAPFAIGVVGSDPFGPVLERVLAGKTIGGRAIVIRRWKTVHDRGSCQILFVSASERDHLKQLLDELGNQPVLTVGDMPGFAGGGGMIGLALSNNRIRFEINEARADTSNLNISSRLLSLARVVTADR